MATPRPSRERECRQPHATIAEAIRCAEQNLGIRPGQKLRPYWGTTKGNSGLIVGWQLDTRRRWRLDYAPGAEGKGPHVNEENFTLPAHLQKVVHRIDRPAISGELQVLLQQRKWTAAGAVEK
jgi:hypothetical protein